VLLTITTTHEPATDLGYLLHKNPARLQTQELAFGHVHVFYPEASAARCTAALLLDVDPIGLVRGRRGPDGAEGLLAQYVNDRPFVASSMLAVAIAQVFGTALGGRSKDRAELAQQRIPLVAHLTSLPCHGGEATLRGLFEPLGYAVTASRQPLDPTVPEWGDSKYFDVTLAATVRLSELLSHLYVLVPVLDDDKHYWVDESEVDKLLRHGGEWLAGHPMRETISRRYLRHQRWLTDLALSRLADESDPDGCEAEHGAEESTIERPIRLAQRRIDEVLAVLRGAAAQRVVDLGCGEGRLLAALLEDRQFVQVTGVDVSASVLKRAAERLHVDRLPPAVRERLDLLHGSLVYRDRRLTGFDAAVAIEVVEHLDPHRLAAFADNLFACIQAPLTIVTTPNADYNVRFPDLPAGRFRHRDHRFEWSRAEFSGWAKEQAQRHGLTVDFSPVGELDAEVGAPTQMAVFRRAGGVA
jgi:3' terminal RNA ribose 2'-O-methyltransferase Hen1